MFHEYRAFIYDSAFKVIQNMVVISNEIGHRPKIEYCRLKTAFVLMSAGMFKETLDTLKAINVSELSDTSLVDYYQVYFRLYSDLRNYYYDPLYGKIYDSIASTYLDSAIMRSSPGSYATTVFIAYKEAHDKRHDSAEVALDYATNLAAHHGSPTRHDVL